MSTTRHLRKAGPALCLILGLAAFGSGSAQDRTVNIDNTVYQEVTTTQPDGTVETRRVPAEKVLPGDTVVYEISYRNDGSEVATDVVVGSPVAAQLVYIDTSTPASGVSVDGGESWGALSALTVLDADGNPRPAQASDVTNLRWIMPSLAPGASGTVSFRARVK